MLKVHMAQEFFKFYWSLQYKCFSYSLPSPQISLAGMDSAKSHNQIASKLLGHREKLMQLFMAKRQDDYMSRKPYR